MNFDPRTEARNEEQADKSYVGLLAMTCAHLEMCMEEIPSQSISDAFAVVWDKGAELITPVEFYKEVATATRALKAAK
jgi:hypothetical protein